MKCDICKKKIDTTFLNKIVGTYIKTDKGKKKAICFECQSKFPTKKEALEQAKA